jgi:hypothetical protein
MSLDILLTRHDSDMLLTPGCNSVAPERAYCMGCLWGADHDVLKLETDIGCLNQLLLVVKLISPPTTGKLLVILIAISVLSFVFPDRATSSGIRIWKAS